jgi:polyisoprenoid-binding protein YceI
LRYKLFFIFVFLANSALLAGEYHVDKLKSNIVKFISDAPLEDFEGVTDKIDGYIYWSGVELVSESELYIEVDLNSLDTGIGLRNRHMRENYLETDKYPLTHFTGKLIEVRKSDSGEYAVTTEGQFFIHGITRKVVINGTMIPVENGFNVKSNFITALTDYKIEVPQLMFFKIDENIKVELNFYVESVEEKE